MWKTLYTHTPKTCSWKHTHKLKGTGTNTWIIYIKHMEKIGVFTDTHKHTTYTHIHTHAHTHTQGRAEDFQIGVALRISVRAAREKFLNATPKFLSATGIFSF